MLRYLYCVALCLFLCLDDMTFGVDYTIKQVAPTDMINKEPSIGSTGIIAWYSYQFGEAESRADVYIYDKGEVKCLTSAKGSFGLHPKVSGEKVIWEGSIPQTRIEWRVSELNLSRKELDAAKIGTGTNTNTEISGTLVKEPVEKTVPVWGICEWSGGRSRLVSRVPKEEPQQEAGEMMQVNEGSGGLLDVASPSVMGDVYAWQSASRWPCGWEISVRYNDQILQLTTNCFYDMEPKVYGHSVVWYGWDGQDFEIYLADLESKKVIQLTDNNYDDMKPVISENMIAWVGYPAVEADIFVYEKEQIRRISENPDDDIAPRIWNGMVVWQGLIGEDYEIFLYDGEEVRQITDNDFDDIDPDINDGTMCWVGYDDNWDAEIFIQGIDETQAQMLTDNEYEDRHPRTAGKAVVWEAKRLGSPLIFVAEPQ